MFNPIYLMTAPEIYLWAILYDILLLKCVAESWQPKFKLSYSDFYFFR